jgi:hypothetical protein
VQQNFVIAEYIMRDVLAAYGDAAHINLHVDLSMSKSSRQALDRYFAEKVSWKTFVSGNERPLTSNIFHDYSHQQPVCKLLITLQTLHFSYTNVLGVSIMR